MSWPAGWVSTAGKTLPVSPVMSRPVPPVPLDDSVDLYPEGNEFLEGGLEDSPRSPVKK